MSPEPRSGSAPRGFFSLPSELRNEIYGLLLVADENPYFSTPGLGAVCPFSPWFGQPGTASISLGLLRVNKTLHREASSVFYGRNRFDLDSGDWFEKLSSWLQQIGGTNASYIQHLLIDFPRWHQAPPDGRLSVKDDSLAAMAKIQHSCTNLQTMTTNLWSTYSAETDLASLKPGLASDYLELVDTTLRSIPTLERIVLVVYEDGPSSDIRQKMEDLGWTLQTCPNGVESEDDYDRGNSDGYPPEDHDIDYYDSVYWRSESEYWRSDDN